MLPGIADFVQPPIVSQIDDKTEQETKGPDGERLMLIDETVNVVDADGHDFVEKTTTRVIGDDAVLSREITKDGEPLGRWIQASVDDVDKFNDLWDKLWKLDVEETTSASLPPPPSLIDDEIPDGVDPEQGIEKDEIPDGLDPEQGNRKTRFRTG